MRTKSSFGNYITLQQTWGAAMVATKDTEVRAKIGGLAAQMEISFMD